MNKGQLYYMKTDWREFDADKHLTVGFEVKPDNPADVPGDHHHLTSQRQELLVNIDLSRDMSKLTIKNPDRRGYMIMF